MKRCSAGCCTAGAVVTAPIAADPTSRAYLPMTPPAYRGAGGVQRASRDASSASLISTRMPRAFRSNVITSPSRTAAIGPPLAASQEAGGKRSQNAAHRRMGDQTGETGFLPHGLGQRLGMVLVQQSHELREIAGRLRRVGP